jgi:hypothetical protein
MGPGFKQRERWLSPDNHGYLNGLSRPERVVHFFRRWSAVPVTGNEFQGQRTTDNQNRIEAFARNHDIPIL